MQKYKISSVTAKISQPVIELPDSFILLAAYDTTEETDDPNLREIIHKIVYLEPVKAIVK